MISQGSRVGPYIVDSFLGEGGSSRVYAVRHTSLSYVRALKVLVRDDLVHRERFLREGRVQADLRHPHVCPVLDRLEVDGLPALVLELVHGVSLDELLFAHRLDASEAMRLADGMLRAVAALHAEGWVHRDLKPGNFLIEHGDRGVTAKLADFGLVERAGSPGTGTHGTPAYMAPELLTGGPATDRADVFSMSVILFEMLCGRPPWLGDDLETIVRARRAEPLPRPGPEVPAEVASLLRVGLGDDPQRRPPAMALLSALGHPEPAAIVTEAAPPVTGPVAEVVEILVTETPPRDFPSEEVPRGLAWSSRPVLVAAALLAVGVAAVLGAVAVAFYLVADPALF